MLIPRRGLSSNRLSFTFQFSFTLKFPFTKCFLLKAGLYYLGFPVGKWPYASKKSATPASMMVATATTLSSSVGRAVRRLATGEHPQFSSASREVSQLKLLLASGYLVTMILSSIPRIKEVRSLPRALEPFQHPHRLCLELNSTAKYSFSAFPCVHWDTVVSINSCHTLTWEASPQPDPELSQPFQLDLMYPWKKSDFPLGSSHCLN